MTEKLLFFCLSFVAVAGAWCQDMEVLQNMPSLNKAIVRQYTEEETVHYCEDTNGRHYFVLHSLNTPGDAIVAAFPNYLFVNDFEVYGDVVYFCGTFPNAGNPVGFVGFISISDLFYNNLPYNFALVNNLYSDGLLSQAHLMSAEKLDLFDDGSHVHLAIVGTLTHNAQATVPHSRTVCDIWFNGANWDGRILFQKDNIVRPYDVTCTDDVVVVSAYDNDMDKCILLMYDKMLDFLVNPRYPNAVGIKDRLADSIVLVERLQDNDIAVVHYFFDPMTGEYGTAAHYVNDVFTFPFSSASYSAHMVHGVNPPIDTLRDIRYSKDSDRLVVVHNIDDPLWTVPTSTVFTWDMYMNKLISGEAWSGVTPVDLMSVDNRISSGALFSTVGTDLTYAVPLFSYVTSQNCYIPQDVLFDELYFPVSIEIAESGTFTYNRPPNVFYYPNPYKPVFDNICR